MIQTTSQLNGDFYGLNMNHKSGDLLTWQIGISGRNCHISNSMGRRAGIAHRTMDAVHAKTGGMKPHGYRLKIYRFVWKIWYKIYGIPGKSRKKVAIWIGKMMLNHPIWGSLCSDKPISSTVKTCLIVIVIPLWICLRIQQNQTLFIHIPHFFVGISRNRATPSYHPL